MNKIAKSARAEFLLLYGRRRIGKSELIDHFIKSHLGVRLLAREESETPFGLRPPAHGIIGKDRTLLMTPATL